MQHEHKDHKDHNLGSQTASWGWRPSTRRMESKHSFPPAKPRENNFSPQFPHGVVFFKDIAENFVYHVIAPSHSPCMWDMVD